MASPQQDLLRQPPADRTAPLFILVLTTLVLVLLLVSLGTVYSGERKTILLISMVFIGLFGMFVVRDIKPYLLFALVMGTSMNVDFFFFIEEPISYHATTGYYFHIIFFPIIAMWFIHTFGIFTGSKRFTLRYTGFIPLFVFLVMTVLSIRQSVAPEFTQYELYSLLFCILLYLLLANTVERRKEVLAIGAGIAAIVLFQGLIAVAQYIKGSMLGLHILGEAERMFVDTTLAQNVRRASGTLGYPNNLALYMDMLLPVVTGMALMTRHFLFRTLFGTAAVFGFIASVLTVSRGGVLGAILSVTLVTLYWAYRNKMLFQIIFIMLLVTAILFAGIMLTENPIKARLFQEGDDSAGSRWPMITVAQGMISNNLMLGVGLNNYTDVAPRYDATSMRITTIFPYPVHNTPLLILAEIGLIGFIGFTFFVAGRLLKGIIMAFDKNKDYAILGFSLAVGLTVFLLHSLVDYTYITSNFTFWFMCGLLTGLYRLRKQESEV